ncbi:MAG: hypothetical protein ABFS37_08335 [Acidobacteriota bacterium]
MKSGFILVLAAILGATPAAAQWQQIGEPGFSHLDIRRHSIALDSEGNPFVFYSTYDTPNEARVVKYSGIAWQTVGPDDVTGVDYWWARDNHIAIDDNDTVYIAYSEIQTAAPYDYSCFVKRYTGTGWEIIAEFVTSDYLIQMDFNLGPDGTPYIAYWDNTEGGAIIKKYNGATWDIIGGGVIAPGQLFALSFIVDAEGNVWTAYADQYDSFLLAAKKFNGSNWEMIGTHISSNSIDLPNSRTDIVIDNDGILYIAAYISPDLNLNIYSFDGAWHTEPFGGTVSFVRFSEVTDANEFYLASSEYFEASQYSNMSIRKRDATGNWSYATGDQYVIQDIRFTHVEVLDHQIFALYRDEPNGQKSSVITYDQSGIFVDGFESGDLGAWSE